MSRIPTVLILALASASAARAQGAPPVDPATAQTVGSLGSIVLSLDAYRADHGTYPSSDGVFVDAEFLTSHLSPVYIRVLPTRDGWGGSLRYASDGETVAILSPGPDGLADRAYPGLAGLEPVEGAGDDLVWSGSHLIICPESIGRLERLGGQKRTMADIRSIATAVEAYKIDHGDYPATTGLVAVATIRSRVEPFYIRTLPLADAWGNALLYRSDGTTYRILSVGWDGTSDRPVDEVVAGTTTHTFESDIVFGDGEFLQWPEGDQQ